MSRLRNIIEQTADLINEEDFNSTRDIYWFRQRLFRRIDQRLRTIEETKIIPKEAKQRQRRKEREEELNKLSRLWVKGHAAPGRLIKVKGARDGHGYREIISIDPQKGTLTCYQLDKKTLDRKQIVQIMPDKVRALIDVDNERKISTLPLQT